MFGVFGFGDVGSDAVYRGENGHVFGGDGFVVGG